MDYSLESISIIKEENNIQSNSNINNVDSKSNHINNSNGEINFEKSLNLSNIENLEDKMKFNENNKGQNMNLSISNLSLIPDNKNIKEKKFTKNINNNNKNILYKKNKNKITKEELNNIPIPIFSCIYCCNEEISFNHLSNEIMSTKYLFQTSIYDMKQLDILIGKADQKITDFNTKKLFNIYLNNLENIKAFIPNKKSYQFFVSKNFLLKSKNNKIIIKKKFFKKIEEKVNKKKKDFYFKEIKGIQKISKNSLNNKCLFNSNSLIIIVILQA